MENRRHDKRQGPNVPMRAHESQQRKTGAPSGFENMNFEEQRGSYKNSDGAGVKGTNVNRERSSNTRDDKMDKQNMDNCRA